MNKKIISRAVLCTAALGAAVKLRSDYERHALTVRHVNIEDKRIDRDIRLAFLSDLHGKSFGPDNSELINAVRESAPDAILLGGDMVSVKHYIPKNYKPLEDLLAGVWDVAPIYYAEGNHELRMKLDDESYPGWFLELRRMLNEYGATYLADKTVMLSKKVSLSGLVVGPEYYRKRAKLHLSPGYISRRLPKLGEAGYSVLMMHTPAYMDAALEAGADLVLSGHFHGGTVVLPVLGPLMSPQLGFFPRFARGEDELCGMRTVTSAGLGTHSINVRINNRPELVIIDLSPADNKVKAIIS